MSKTCISTSFEGSKDLGISFVVEFIFTCVLMLVIFLNFSPNSKYRKALLVNGPNSEIEGYTFGPMITGFVLMALVYFSIFIGKNTLGGADYISGGGIFAGHMFPLITLPGMSGEAGFASISFIKGIILLFAQFLAMFLMWYWVFKTETFN